MIRVKFSPSDLTGEKREWWEAWQDRVEAATRAAREEAEAGRAPALDQTIWADLKKWLFRHVFFNKCAYCEGRVTPQSYGDGEHWRPKGGVREKVDGKMRTVERDNVPHPGYWWLAYEWSNLLPACQKCNNSPGKGMQFPVAKEHVFAWEDSGVDDLDEREEPLLLHPFKGDDPEEHLGFNEFGQIFARSESPKGEATIEVFDLRRGELAEDRRAVIEEGRANYMRAMFLAGQEGLPLKHVIRELFGTPLPYSAAVRASAVVAFEEFVKANLNTAEDGDGTDDG